MASLQRINVKCVDCGQEFSISPEEQKWLADRKLQLFKRCSACRKKRKASNNK